jgi:MFS family permease
MEDATPNGYRLAKIMAVLMPSYAMAFAISTTFWLVFIAEELGHGDYIVGLAQAGILIAIQLAVQTTLDYPTGTLGDRFGQRYVIASALLCYAGAFFLTSLVSSESSFFLYVDSLRKVGLGAHGLTQTIKSLCLRIETESSMGFFKENLACFSVLPPPHH